MTNLEKQLRETLKRTVDCIPQPSRPGFFYISGEDFVLRHGRFYPWKPLPRKINRGAPRSCYGNALALAACFGYQYVEGYATSFDVGPSFAFHHAWVISRNGSVIDNTWPRGLAYFGVEFAVERAAEAAWIGDTNILDDWKRNWPLFHSQWHGEIHGPWPRIPVLEYMRKRAAGKPAREELAILKQDMAIVSDAARFFGSHALLNKAVAR